MKHLITDVHLPPKERALTFDRGKDVASSRTAVFSFSDRAETRLIDLQRVQEGLKCFWKPSGFFAIVYLNSTCHVGLSAQLMMVTKAGGLRVDVGAWLCFTIITSSLAKVLKMRCSRGCDYRVVPAAVCSQAAWMPEWKKKSACDKRKASQLGPLTKASATYGHRAQRSTAGPGIWEKLFQEKFLLGDAY